MPFTCEDYRRNYGHMNKKSPCIPILNVICRGFEQWLALFTPYLISSFAYIDTSMGVIIIGEKKVKMWKPMNREREHKKDQTGGIVSTPLILLWVDHKA